MNAYAGLLHLVSGILVIAGVVAPGKFSSLSRDLHAFYRHFDVAPGMFKVSPDPRIAFTRGNLGVLLAPFPFVSAAAHFIIAFLRNRGV